MPLHRLIPGTPADWLQRARSDLAMAKVPLPEESFYEERCFHAQRAEKAIKAVFRHRGHTFRYTHDLEQLLAELPQLGESIPPDVLLADDLTPYAWETRYPFQGEAVTRQEYLEAVRPAECVVDWANAVIGPRPPPSLPPPAKSSSCSASWAVFDGSSNSLRPA